jgi:hypothetical protein
MSENLFNIEGLTVNNIVADKIQAKQIEIIKDGSGDSDGGTSSAKSIFGDEVKVNNRTYKDHMLKVAEDGTITNSNSIAIVANDGTEDNVITHKNPAGITSSPYISIESHNNGASLTLKDNSDLANDLYGVSGGFELKAGDFSLKGETDGNLTWNDIIKLKKDGRIEILSEKTNSATLGFDYSNRTGAFLAVRGNDYTNNPGGFDLFARNSTQSVTLQGKVDGTLTWNAKPVVTLVSSWVSGGNWYRKYSDGWIEQSGTISGTNNAFATVTLYLAFKNIDYTILLTQGGTNTSADRVSQYQSKTTTSFKASRDDVSTAIRWYACGF